jgi:hypothetical protein
LSYHQYPARSEIPLCLEQSFNIIYANTNVREESHVDSTAITLLESNTAVVNDTQHSISDIAYLGEVTREWHQAFDHLVSMLEKNSSFYYFTHSFSIHFSSINSAVISWTSPSIREKIGDGELILSEKQIAAGLDCERYLFFLICTSLSIRGTFAVKFESTTNLINFIKHEWSEPRAEHRSHHPLLVSSRQFLNSTVKMPRLGRLEAKSKKGDVSIVSLNDGFIFTRDLPRIFRLFSGDFEVATQLFRDTCLFNEGGGKEESSWKGEWRDGSIFV